MEKKRRAMDVINERREEYEGSESLKAAIARAARLFEKFVSRDVDGALRLWYGNFLSNKETRASGLATLPEGFRTGWSVLMENFCLLHIDTMADESIPDETLLASLIASPDAEEFGYGIALKVFPNWPVEYDLHLIPKENYPNIDWIWRAYVPLPPRTDA